MQGKRDISEHDTRATKLDLTGQDRLARNVAASWAGQVVFIISGFVLPRLIDRRIGQEALGVWDFAWSLVAYFGLVQGGVTSSINRYVAKYRATGDEAGVNRVVSSVTCVLAVGAALILGLAVVFGWTLPGLFGQRLGAHPVDAQWVVLLLGTRMAVELLFSGYGGVITGYHRWDVHNAVHAGSHVIAVVGMIVVLTLGYGLPALALACLIGELLGRLLRIFLAHWIFPGLSVRLSHVRWSQAREMLGFGGKTFVPQIADLCLNQTASILVLAYLGPATLAVYSRPRALVRQVAMLVAKFSLVLTPTASSIQALGDMEQLRSFFIKSARLAGYISLPLIAMLAILGGPLLQVWMGPSYAADGTLLLTVLALGHATTILQLAVRAVLMGVNAHGRLGVANLIASILAVGLVVFALGSLESGLVGVGVALAIPLTIVNGIYVPWYACRQLGLPVRRFLRETLVGPICCVVPFCLVLIGFNLLFADRPWLSLAFGSSIGGVLLGSLYWRFVLGDSLKSRTTGRLRGMFYRGATNSA